MTSILDALDRHAAARPDALALDGISYAALRDASLRVATHFRRSGIAPGDRIVLYAENSPGFVFAYLGGLRCGAVVVPANVLYRAADLAHVASDSGAELMCVSARSRPFAEPVFAKTLVDLATVTAWAHDDATPFDTFLAAKAQRTALLVYTSGTTGRSKGAELTHRNLGAIAEQVTTAWHWSAPDTLLLTLPLFHVHGLCAGLNGTLFAGSRLFLRERFDVDDVVTTLRDDAVTMFFGVPTMYVRLLETAASGPFPSMRLFVSGSAALPASVHAAFERRFGTSILERYGATEFGFALTNRYEGPRYAGTVGFPLPGVGVRLLSQAGEDVATGEIGEIFVSGPNVGAGYWHDAEATAAAFVRDAAGTRWFRSGDLATYEPERGFTIVGRTKEMIVSGGFNVYPREVEEELQLIPGVRAAAVLGRPDMARGEVPVAFLETDGVLEAEAVLDVLRERLASFKIPKTIAFVAELPRNAMGKVDKPRLRASLTGDLGREHNLPSCENTHRSERGVASHAGTASER